MSVFEVKARLRGVALTGAILGTMALLNGCEESHLRLAPDFGVAVRQDQAAQIADPDARYAEVLPAGSDGARTSIAVTRYRTDKVIQPVSSQTSEVGQAAANPGAGGPAGTPQ
jgi:type IV pilus biogenesis protein CpaD/CtpE